MIIINEKNAMTFSIYSEHRIRQSVITKLNFGGDKGLHRLDMSTHVNFEKRLKKSCSGLPSVF